MGSKGKVHFGIGYHATDGAGEAPAVLLQDIDHSVSGSILESRVRAYRISDDAYLPLSSEDFSRLYGVLHGNIRDALSAADDFCNWVADDGLESSDPTVMHCQFQGWLKRECLERLEAARPILSARPWKLFDDIVSAGGQCSPGAFKDFSFDTPQGMRTQVLKLEAANLVKSVRDEEDNRRKTIVVTSAGWLVEYARRTGAGSLFPTATDADEEHGT